VFVTLRVPGIKVVSLEVALTVRVPASVVSASLTVKFTVRGVSTGVVWAESPVMTGAALPSVTVKVKVVVAVAELASVTRTVTMEEPVVPVPVSCRLPMPVVASAGVTTMPASKSTAWLEEVAVTARVFLGVVSSLTVKGTLIGAARTALWAPMAAMVGAAFPLVTVMTRVMVLVRGVAAPSVMAKLTETLPAVLKVWVVV